MALPGCGVPRPAQRLFAFLLPRPAVLPSCEKKRQILWAEWLCEEVLAKTAHRHVVLTIPRLLRPLSSEELRHGCSHHRALPRLLPRARFVRAGVPAGWVP